MPNGVPILTYFANALHPKNKYHNWKNTMNVFIQNHNIFDHQIGYVWKITINDSKYINKITFHFNSLYCKHYLWALAVNAPNFEKKKKKKSEKIINVVNSWNVKNYSFKKKNVQSNISQQNIFGCDHNQMSQKPCWIIEKLLILSNIFI